MIHVIIVDDELLAGVGIQSLIDGEDEIQVDGVFAGPEEAIPFLRGNPVDLVITDIEMAEMNGLDFISVIRSADLADGVIILSCHDDFSYAQEAISKGTDSYLLKHKISGPQLIEEIKKIYRKNHKRNEHRSEEFFEKSLSDPAETNEYYSICLLRFFSTGGSDEREEGQFQGDMMVHLIERLVQRYQMGTVIRPYDKTPFIVFRTARTDSPEERSEKVFSAIEILLDNIRQYYSGRIVVGLSTEFTELTYMCSGYEEAEAAAEKYYYEPDGSIFSYHAPLSDFRDPEFSFEEFLTAEGPRFFSRELAYYLKQASICEVSPETMRVGLAQSVSRMLFRVMEKNPYLLKFQNKKELDGKILTTIIHAGNVRELEKNLNQVLDGFWKTCLEAWRQDPMAELLTYIDAHLSEKLTLNELAEIGCMSVPTLTKKFKEHTGMTLVQYLNDRRILRAKGLMADPGLSLEQIAEKTGFSNANYLVRVFKKVTGKTVSDFRN